MVHLWVNIELELHGSVPYLENSDAWCLALLVASKYEGTLIRMPLSDSYGLMEPITVVRHNRLPCLGCVRCIHTDAGAEHLMLVSLAMGRALIFSSAVRPPTAVAYQPCNSIIHRVPSAAVRPNASTGEHALGLAGP